MTVKSLLSLEQFNQLSAPEGVSYELDEGELLTMVRPLPIHSVIQVRLGSHLESYVMSHPPGVVLVEAEFQLSEDTVRIPDLAVILGEGARQLNLYKRPAGAPTLAVEVISPDDLARNINRKVKQYLKAGSKAVWVVYPEDHQVDIWRPGRPLEVCGADDLLEDQELLSGFSVALSILFP
jgi:Uma2 family endonuclease